MRLIALAQTYLAVFTGLAGEPQYETEYAARARLFLDAAINRLAIDQTRTVYFGQAGVAPARRESILAVLHRLAAGAEDSSLVVVVLIGHGSVSGDGPAFNLAGPDLTVADLAGALAGFRTKRIVVVNMISTSGAWISGLSAAGRIVITATRSAAERDEPVFGRFFVQAFAQDGADTDKNHRVSVLEAFDYARRETDRYYTSAGRLRPEHAMLDDNGDGVGTLEPAPSGGDGALAAATFLDRPAIAERDPVIAALLVRQDSLERAVIALRAQRGSMDSTAYDRQMEDLLLTVARVGREIRDKRSGRP